MRKAVLPLPVLLCVAGLVLCAEPARAVDCSSLGPPAAEKVNVGGLQAQLDRGRWFEEHTQPACAAEAYRAALVVAPRSLAATDGLARALTASGDASAAIQLLGKAPTDETLTVDLANAYEKAGDTSHAGQLLVRSVRTHPNSVRLASALVVLMANHGQLDEAYRLADQFAHGHPADPNAQKLFLRVLVAANDMAAARPLAKKLLVSAPKDGEVLYLNGVLERRAGDLPAAKAHLQQSVAINPHFADSRYNLGLVLLQDGEAKLAADELHAAVQLGTNDPEAHLNLSKALRASGDPTAADAELKLYQQAMQSRSADEMAASKATDAEQALSKGDKAKAVALYREALEVKPQDARLAYELAMALDATGDTQGERTALQTAVNTDPGMALAQHQLGYLLFQSGDNDGAEEHFRLALKADPAFTQAWISLAATLATRSKFTEARQAVQHALALDPHNAQAEQMRRMLPAEIGAH